MIPRGSDPTRGQRTERELRTSHAYSSFCSKTETQPTGDGSHIVLWYSFVCIILDDIREKKIERGTEREREREIHDPGG